MEEQPEVFGMHDNALVAFNESEASRIVGTILSIQPRVRSTSANAQTPEELVDALAVDIINRIPADLSAHSTSLIHTVHFNDWMRAAE